MSFSTVLSSALLGKTDFCCLCFGEVDLLLQNAVMGEEVFVDDYHTVAVSQIVCTVLGEMETVAAYGMFCERCKESLVNSYNFISMCKENSAKLSSAVGTLLESFQNTLHFGGCKSLFVSLDMENFTSQQYYDHKKLQARSEAYKHFINNIKIKSEEKGFINYDNESVPTSDMVNEEIFFTRYTCKQCMRTFCKENELRLHFFSKHQPKLFECDNCPEVFISDGILKSHTDEHKAGVCSQCGKHFPNQERLNKHELGHSIKIVCKECGRRYRSREAFKKHIADNICQQKSKKNSREGIYQCDYCKKRYWIKPYLAKHIKYEHGDAIGYKCKYCNKQFYTPSRLETHIVKHTGEKKFTCSICERKFVTRTSLLYHTRLHTGERPYKCDYCDSAFLSASRKLDHMRRHHMPPSLKCDLCDMMFKATSSLLKHRKRHMNPLSRLNGGLRFPPPPSTEETVGLVITSEN